jgi:hypothetical protein
MKRRSAKEAPAWAPRREPKLGDMVEFFAGGDDVHCKAVIKAHIAAITEDGSVTLLLHTKRECVDLRFGIRSIRDWAQRLAPGEQFNAAHTAFWDYPEKRGSRCVA